MTYPLKFLHNYSPAGCECSFLPQVCFSLQSVVVWLLFLLWLGAGGVGFVLGGPTWGTEGVQQITGWGPDDGSEDIRTFADIFIILQSGVLYHHICM